MQLLGEESKEAIRSPESLKASGSMGGITWLRRKTGNVLVQTITCGMYVLVLHLVSVPLYERMFRPTQDMLHMTPLFY